MFGNAHEIPLSSFGFEHETRLRASQYSHHLAGDINGDRLGDILSITREGKLQTFLGTQNPERPFRRLADQSHEPVKKLNGKFNPAQLQLKDMNKDGMADLVVIQNDGTYTISYGQEEGMLSEPIDDTLEEGILSASLEDTLGEKEGKKVMYCPNLLAKQGEQKIIGIADRAEGQALLSLNAKGEVNAHPFDRIRVQDSIAYYQLGSGEDRVIGEINRKNHFEIGAGTKYFTGGNYADTFLLQGKVPPSESGHLKGGQASVNAQGLADDQDTVIASVKPESHQGYEINLFKGYVKYTGSKSSIAKLSDIENAIGHPDTNDQLIGNDKNNFLEGAGGVDTLTGHKGDDILSLHAGVADGGKGIDNYRILQNNSASDTAISHVKVIDSGMDEDSNVVLDYAAANVLSISFKETALGGDVLLTLRNDNGTITEVLLEGAYSVAQDNQRALQHRYFLYTRDGMLIKSWPNKLMQQADGGCALPPLTLENFHGTNVWMGTGAADHYVLDDLFLNHEMVIHNESDFPRQDQLKLPWLLEETLLGIDSQDLIVRYKSQALSNQVRIKNFMRDERYRHLSLIDPAGNVEPLHFIEEKMLSQGNQHLYDLAQRQQICLSQVLFTQGDDTVVIRDENEAAFIKKTVSLGGGDDNFIDLSMGGFDIQSEAGNDFISIQSGDNRLTGGQGADNFELGNGDDTYYFTRGDGHDIIRDSGGQDTLEISPGSITLGEIRRMRKGNDLLIEVGGPNSGDSVTVMNHYAESNSMLDLIKLGGYQLKIDDLAEVKELVQAMWSFGARHSESATQTDAFIPPKPSDSSLITGPKPM